MARIQSKPKPSRRQTPAATGGRMTPWQFGQFTGHLIGDLKNAQVAHVRVGVKLAGVRDENLDEAIEVVRNAMASHPIAVAFGENVGNVIAQPHYA